MLPSILHSNGCFVFTLIQSLGIRSRCRSEKQCAIWPHVFHCRRSKKRPTTWPCSFPSVQTSFWLTVCGIFRPPKKPERFLLDYECCLCYCSGSNKLGELCYSKVQFQSLPVRYIWLQTYLVLKECHLSYLVCDFAAKKPPCPSRADGPCVYILRVGPNQM